MSSSQIKLGGQFKVDVYDKNHKFLRSSDFIDNFITNSGVKYPWYFAFADCFRYLSLGSGNATNSTGTFSSPATTGLQSGASGYTYIGSGSYSSGWLLGGGCGNYSVPGSNTISLIRQWILPNLSGDAFEQNYSFREIAVSPGRPKITGYTLVGESFVNTGLCLCSEMGYSKNGTNPGDPANYYDNNKIYGQDCSQIAIYHSLLPQLQEQAFINSVAVTRERLSLCDATAAFARITGNFNVNSGEILSVTYKLNLSFDTGVKLVEPAESPVYATDNNWRINKFYSNITNPGIKLISDGSLGIIKAPDGGWSNYRLQQFNYAYLGSIDIRNIYGESFIPSQGIPLEPSAIYGQDGNFVAYLSNDSTQFLVNPTGGFCITGQYEPWTPGGKSFPQNSGLLPFSNPVSGAVVSSANTLVYNNSPYWSQNPYEIRKSTSSAKYPDITDISIKSETVSPSHYQRGYPTPGFSFNGRTGTVVCSYNMDGFLLSYPFQSLQAKSLVLAYRDAPQVVNQWSQYGLSSPASYQISLSVPFYDCLFSGRYGSSDFLPTVVTGSQDNSIKTTIQNSESTGFNYLSGNVGYYYPAYNTRLMWVAECPPGVVGCS